MPMENCDDCRRCLPCPVTTSEPSEGAYPIVKDMGNIWYCTSCFYCEDVCPKGSPREYAIHRRRSEQQTDEQNMAQLQKIREQGHIFPLDEENNELRSLWGLPPLVHPDQQELQRLFDAIIGNHQSFESKPKKVTDKQAKAMTRQEAAKKSEPQIALFLGCIIPYRIPEYELSARQLLQKLGVNYIDLPFSCCGSIMTESHSEELWLVIGGYNLALAEAAGIKTIISLCGGCTGNLRRVNQTLQKESEKREKVNERLKLIGKEYHGTLEVIHFSEFLHQKIEREELSTKILPERKKLLNHLTISVQVPCQVIRPQNSSPSAGLKEQLLTDLLALTTINIQSFPYETLCCGSTLLLYNQSLAYKIAKKRLEILDKLAVDALILGCGNCSMNYKIHQKEYSNTNLATFFFTEILAFAMGFSNQKLEQLIQKKNGLE